MTQPAPQPVPEFVVVEHVIRLRTTVAVRELEGMTASHTKREIELAAMRYEQPRVCLALRLLFRDAEYDDTTIAEIIDGH